MIGIMQMGWVCVGRPTRSGQEDETCNEITYLHWVRTDTDQPIFVTSAEAGDSDRAYRCEFCHQAPLPRSAQLIACLRIGKLGRRGLERSSELREQWRALLATRLGGLLTPLVLGERDRVPVLVARLE
jgi:hypothetical protein